MSDLPRPAENESRRTSVPASATAARIGASRNARPGMVYLVGAGPGDPGLLTRRGAQLLAAADVVVYDGLVDPAQLALTSADCEHIYAGKKHAPTGAPLTQDEINKLLVAKAQAGHQVVRLKGGDPFVFGRGAEECLVLSEAGIGFEIVPGVTAATAVSAYAGIPLTARAQASTVTFATGHEAAGKSLSAIDWPALAHAGTVVLFMAVRTADECARQLIAAGRSPGTPAAVVQWGTTSRQRTITAPLSELAQRMRSAGIKPPALLIIGQVVELRPLLDWFERRPLFGHRVLVPRPLAQASGFADALAGYGGEPVVMPVTRIVAADAVESGARERLDAALAMLAQGRFSWVLLASVNAVERLFQEIAVRGQDARILAGCQLACVGQVTAGALAQHGLRADLVPARNDAGGLAQAIIEAAGGALHGARILLPRAAGGRDEAIDALRVAGAEVEACVLYRSIATPADEPALARGLTALRTGTIEIMAFFAPSQVRALFDIAAVSGIDIVACMRACRVIAAIGTTTAKALRERGIEVDVIPERADADSFATAIAAHVANRSEPA